MKNQLEVAQFLDNMSDILSKVLSVDKSDISVTLETKLVNGAGINDISLASIDYVDYLVHVEEEYDVVYDFDTQIHTIGDVYDYISSYKEKAGIEKNESQ